MARYTKAKGKVNRRLGISVYETNGARRALDRRDSPPGMHTRRGKPSTYALALLEKQKLKHFYGLGERTLRRMFAEAKRSAENTGAGLKLLCERRLDNVVCRAGFARTRAQSRQGIVHGHFLVNGRKVDIPSYQVRPGDVIDVKRTANLLSYYKDLVDSDDRPPCLWLHTYPEQLRVEVSSLPTGEESTLPVEINLVIELLSR
jgi:small subunit ribosomal protein S4